MTPGATVFVAMLGVVPACVALVLHLTAKESGKTVSRLADTFSLSHEIRRLLRTMPLDPLLPIIASQSYALYLLSTPPLALAISIVTTCLLCLIARSGRR